LSCGVNGRSAIEPCRRGAAAFPVFRVPIAIRAEPLRTINALRLGRFIFIFNGG
jgi:hypothetical protein